MSRNILSDAQKKDLIKEVLGAEYHTVGNHFPAFSKMMDGVGYAGDAFTFAELIPALNAYLSGARIAAVQSRVSLAAILIFPVQQLINLINANETGYRMYSFRSVAYALTAWAFEEPSPSSSPRITANLRRTVDHQGMAKYNKVWWESASNATRSIEKTCGDYKIESRHLKAVFRSIGNGQRDQLCKLILTGFEPNFGHTTLHIWQNGYNVLYPH